MKNLKIYYMIATAISTILLLMKIIGLSDIGWAWILAPVLAPFIVTFMAIVFVICAAICIASLFLIVR